MMAQDPILEKMLKMSVPFTRENYLKFAYFGDPPAQLGPEEEAGLPWSLQLFAEVEEESE